jgi:hypothetical protein
MGWMTQESGFKSQNEQEIILFCTASKSALALSQPCMQQVLDSLSPPEKWQRCETDHSPPSSTEVTNVWNYALTSLHLHSMCVTKHRDNFNFTFTGKL